MPHKRSNSRRNARFGQHQSTQNLHAERKLVQKQLEKSTVYDRETKEKICDTTAIELAWDSKQPCITKIVPRVERGEVLSDPRGQGSIDQDRYIEQTGVRF